MVFIPPPYCPMRAGSPNLAPGFRTPGGTTPAVAHSANGYKVGEEGGGGGGASSTLARP